MLGTRWLKRKVPYARLGTFYLENQVTSNDLTKVNTDFNESLITANVKNSLSVNFSFYTRKAFYSTNLLLPKVTMGCDGGTIPTRDELVRTKKKPEQVETFYLLLCSSVVLL
jgi:hypothetical protein